MWNKAGGQPNASIDLLLSPLLGCLPSISLSVTYNTFTQKRKTATRDIMVRCANWPLEARKVL